MVGIPSSESQASRLSNFAGAVDGKHAMEVKPSALPRIVSDLTTTIGTEATNGQNY